MNTPSDINFLIPFINVKNPEKTLAFYQAVFGFEPINVNQQGEYIVHADLMYQGKIVALLTKEGMHNPDEKAPVTSGHTSPIKLMLYVESVDETYTKALRHGGVGIAEPENYPWGERYAHIKDPDGYHWQLAEVLESPAS